MAVGIVAGGQGLAGKIWPPVFSRVKEAVGWRDMLFLYAVFARLVMLALLTTTQELWLIYVISALFGIGYAGIFPAYAVKIREHLPASQAGRRASIVFLFGAMGMGRGGWIGGFLFDQTGFYMAPFLIGVGFNLVIVGALITKQPRHPEPCPA